MVIDTSALLAIFYDEPEREHFNQLIASAPSRSISTGTYLEAAIVIEARIGREGTRHLKQFISIAGIAEVPLDADQAEIAAEGYSRYGKGNRPAGLNFGDCFAYALAKHTGEPLLFKGNDFSQTDIASAGRPAAPPSTPCPPADANGVHYR